MLNQFELKILDFIAEHLRCVPLDLSMPIITNIAYLGIGPIILALILVLTKKKRKTGLAIGAALIFGLLICNLILKPAVARIRPYDLAGISPYLVSAEKDFSFPSGHTVAIFATAVVICIREHRWGIPAVIVAILVAFSRLYLYVHFPSDVIVGIAAGTLSAVFACFIVNKIPKVRDLPE